MDSRTQERYCKMVELAEKDCEYTQLLAEYHTYDEKLRELLERLPEADVLLLMDYIGVCGALWRRMAELACREIHND